jgi:hypothetical protein
MIGSLILPSLPPSLPSSPQEPFYTSEGTVSYMYHAETPRLIKKDNPRAKFIFALRDPVARAWSDYRFNYKGR